MRYFIVILGITMYLSVIADEKELEKSARIKAERYQTFIAAMKILEKIERDQAIKEITEQLPTELTHIIQSFDTP